MNDLKRIDFRVAGKWLDGLLGRFTQAALDNTKHWDGKEEIKEAIERMAKFVISGK